MSKKRKQQRANHTEKERKQAERVIGYIIAALAIFAIAYAGYTIYLVS